MKKGYKLCPHCNAEVKAKKLSSHIKKVHSKETNDKPRRPKQSKRSGKSTVGKKPKTNQKIAFFAVVAVIVLALVLVPIIYLATKDEGGIKDDGDDKDLPYDEIKATTSDGWEIYGRDYFNSSYSPLLVLVHGMNTDQTVWDPLMPALQNRGYNIVTIDLRGFGKSNKQYGEIVPSDRLDMTDFEVMHQDVRTLSNLVISKHRMGDPTMIIAGASLGGNIGLMYAKDYPGLDGLIMLSPVDRFVDAAMDYVDYVDDIPSLIITSTKDINSLDVSHQLDDALPNGLLVTIDIFSHGSDMLREVPKSIEHITNWLDTEFPVV